MTRLTQSERKADLKARVLTGIKPTGHPHLGNLLGMIRPAIQLSSLNDSWLFIADYHALAATKRPELIRRSTYEVAASWLALGLNPDESVFYRQSDVPQVHELTWVLACVTGKGLMNRAHAYKAATQANRAAGRDLDAGVTMGLYSYPILMAADILLFKANLVPVGRDQQQHVEMARRIAASFNSHYGDTFPLPDSVVQEDSMLVPGLDGRKMSKSYRNEIPLFAEEDELRRLIGLIRTTSAGASAPKDPTNDTVFSLFKALAPKSEVEEMKHRYLAGDISHKEAKGILSERLLAEIAPARQRYNDLLANPSRIDVILARGASQARHEAELMISDVRHRVGIDP